MKLAKVVQLAPPFTLEEGSAPPPAPPPALGRRLPLHGGGGRPGLVGGSGRVRVQRGDTPTLEGTGH